MDGEPCALDGDPAARVEAEEPDRLTTAEPDVRPDVQLRERTGARDGGEEARRDVLHPEGHDPDPGVPVECVDLETFRDERPDRLDGHGPVGEQQVRPAHAPDPRLSAHARQGWATATFNVLFTRSTIHR